MKKVIYITSVLFLGALISNAQTIFVANNNPGAVAGTNGFIGNNSIQNAINNAANGDIIYVVPSNVLYNNILVNKEVTIFGVGISPDKSLGALSTLRIVDIDASNVRISGIIANNYVRIGNNSTGTLSNILIENVNSKGGISQSNTTGTLNNVLFRNCIMRAAYFYTTTANAITVTNCVIYTGSTSTGVGAIKGTAVKWLNNLFVRNGTGLTISEIDDCLLDHNIFYGTNVTVTSNSTNNEWNDNMSFSSQDEVFPIGVYSNFTTTSNIESTDPLFVDMPLTTSWLDSYDFTLTAASPALNINGTDIGPSGGTTPFDEEGNLLPLIQSVELPPIIPVGSDLPVTIKAKGN